MGEDVMPYSAGEIEYRREFPQVPRNSSGEARQWREERDRWCATVDERDERIEELEAEVKEVRRVLLRVLDTPGLPLSMLCALTALLENNEEPGSVSSDAGRAIPTPASPGSSPSPTEAVVEAAVARVFGAIGVLDLPADSDCLAVALATYYSDHPGRPDPDPDDEDLGWGAWVVEQSNAAIRRIAEVAVDAARKEG